jgi:hypothetical protein
MLWWVKSQKQINWSQLSISSTKNVDIKVNITADCLARCHILLVQGNAPSKTRAESALRQEIHKFSLWILCNTHSEELNPPSHLENTSPY